MAIIKLTKPNQNEAIHMKHWEVEHALAGHVRIEWNESATFNLQTPIGGEWVDYHCFTCYGIDTEQEALEFAVGQLDENEEVQDET